MNEHPAMTVWFFTKPNSYEIYAVNVLRETERCLYLQNGTSPNKKGNRFGEEYFPTRKEAAASLLIRARAHIEYLEKTLRKTQAEIKRLEKII